MTKVFIPFKHNSIFNRIEGSLSVVSSLDECDTVLLWNDVNPLERGIINLARSKGKRTLVVQHGRRGSSRYFPPFNEKIQADKLLVWGDSDKRALVGVGQDSSRIGVVGSPILLRVPPRIKHEGIRVVFCPEHWDTEVEENKWVKKELQKLQKKHKNIKVVTKIIESHNPKDYENPIQSNRNSPQHLSVCADVLSTADIVVGVSESTFEIIAQAMDIPVVIMDEWTPKACNGDERYKTYRRVVSEGSAKCKAKDLIKTILYHLENPGDLQEGRRNAVIDEGGLGLDTIELIKKEL